MYILNNHAITVYHSQRLIFWLPIVLTSNKKAKTSRVFNCLWHFSFINSIHVWLNLFFWYYNTKNFLKIFYNIFLYVVNSSCFFFMSIEYKIPETFEEMRYDIDFPEHMTFCSLFSVRKISDNGYTILSYWGTITYMYFIKDLNNL